MNSMFGRPNFRDYEKYFSDLIIQIIHAFYVEDRETALNLLQKMKVEYLQNATLVTPTIGKVIKGIIRSLPSGAFPTIAQEAAGIPAESPEPVESKPVPVVKEEKEPIPAPRPTQPRRPKPAINPLTGKPQVDIPPELTDELKSKLIPVREKEEKKKKIIEELEGSIDDLE